MKEMTLRTMKFKWKYVVLQVKEIPQCDSESIEINDMIDLLLKVLKSLKDVGQKESFLKFMRLLSTSLVLVLQSCQCSVQFVFHVCDTTGRGYRRIW